MQTATTHTRSCTPTTTASRGRDPADGQACAGGERRQQGDVHEPALPLDQGEDREPRRAATPATRPAPRAPRTGRITSHHRGVGRTILGRPSGAAAPVALAQTSGMLSPAPASATAQPAARQHLRMFSSRRWSSLLIRLLGQAARPLRRPQQDRDAAAAVPASMASARTSSCGASPRTATTMPSPERVEHGDGVRELGRPAEPHHRQVVEHRPAPSGHPVRTSRRSVRRGAGAARTAARTGTRRPRPPPTPPTRSSTPGPSPRWPTARASSSTVARICRGCSSRRTISSPRRAVERQ